MRAVLPASRHGARHVTAAQEQLDHDMTIGDRQKAKNVTMVGTAGTSKWNKIEHRLFGHIMESCPEFPENYAFRLTRKRYYRAVNLDDPPDLSHLGLWIVGRFTPTRTGTSPADPVGLVTRE